MQEILPSSAEPPNHAERLSLAKRQTEPNGSVAHYTWFVPTFWDNHLPAVATIFTPFLVCLKPKILPIKQPTFEKKI